MAVTQSNGLNRGESLASPLDETTAYDVRAGEQADSDDIRREIDRTRSVMDRTIDELGERLQPRNLFDEVVASVRGSLFSQSGATTGASWKSSGTGCGSTGSRQMSEQLSDAASRMGHSLIEAVRENPVPAALMGAGLAWLLFEDKAERAYRHHRLTSNRKEWDNLSAHSGSFVDARTGEPYDESYGAGYEDLDADGEPDVVPPSLKDKAAHMAASVKGAAYSAKETLGSAAEAIGDLTGKAAQATGTAARTVKSAARKTGRSASSASHVLGDYGRGMGGSMRHASESAKGYSQSAAESMRHYGHMMADKSQAGYAVSRERFNHALDDKPLAVGVAALAAGLLAGFALPRTRVEDRTMGQSADQLKEEARRRGLEAVEQGREVVTHVAQETLGEAEGQGLTPDSLGGKVARVAKDAIQAAKDSAQREGIDTGTLAEKAKQIGDVAKQKGKEELQGVKSGLMSETSKSMGESGMSEGMETTPDYGTAGEKSTVESMWKNEEGTTGDSCRR